MFEGHNDLTSFITSVKNIIQRFSQMMDNGEKTWPYSPATLQVHALQLKNPSWADKWRNCKRQNY